MDQKELIDRLRRDPKAVQSLMTSADGQRLMQLLSGGDGGRTLQQAAGEAAAGNTLQMAQMLKSFMLYDWGLVLTCIGGSLVAFTLLYFVIYRVTARTYYRIVRR